MPDLWPPDIAKIANVTPVSILREQASLLGEKAKNIVTAHVEIDDEQSPHDFNYQFFIFGPALQNYRFRLFSISHSIELYPVHFYLDSDIASELKLDRTTSVNDEQELLDMLQRIFASKKTRRVVAAILGQSVSNIEDPNDIPF